MHIDADRIRHIAGLARLELADAEARACERDLESILTMVDRMESVATGGVAPLSHPLDVGQRLRDDVVTEPDRRDSYQAGAPETDDGFYVVPRVIE